MEAEHPAGLSRLAASWHPARWVWSLLSTALESGRVTLFTHTKVTSVADRGEHYELDTSRGVMRARCVINATESYSALLHPQLRGVLHAVQTQAAFADGGPRSIQPYIGLQSREGWFGRQGDGVFFRHGRHAHRVQGGGTASSRPISPRSSCWVRSTGTSDAAGCT